MVSCLALALLVFLPNLAFAQAGGSSTSSLGALFCNVHDEIIPFGNFFAMLAYVAGAYIGAMGVHSLARHVEAPGQAPLPQALWRLVGGSALLALPSFAGAVITTLFMDPGTNGLTACAPGATAGAGTGTTLDLMMQNFVTNIKNPITTVLSVSSMVFGVFLIYHGLLKSSRYGTDPRANSVTSIITSLAFGAIFMVIGQSMGTVMSSVFGTDSITSFSAISWTSVDSLGAGATNFKNAIHAALTFFQIVGFISFIRGLNVLRNAIEGKGQATMAQGFTHIIGGVLAINIYYFLVIMDATFGTGFVSLS